MTHPDPIPAATVVVMREQADGPPELLMLERSKAMVFAGGAWVFPGGRIDAGDRALAAALGLDDEDGPARIAAIRESIEEAGVAPGVVPAPDAVTIARLRAALHGGATIGAVLEAEDLALDPDALVPFARWLPLGMSHRIFDTRFYLALHPADAPEPSVDATENTRLAWTTARGALVAADAGRAEVIFPTRCNLERLALFADHAQAVAYARRYGIRAITPWIEARDGIDYVCIPDDLGYPVTALPARFARRA
ncbi:NUDIX hydrolase [Sphingomonas sp.]|uniref:NUDIX hydrolase n=1 Tax=Sphingomonas sp. TaxID=28214 RepID=UPI002DD69E8A|nr:NUDIX domain-containing protein [Sphingomonas sp.]